MTKHKSYDWLLFDADNTLLDFHAAERVSLQAAMEDEGLPFSNEHHALYETINKACWHDFEHGLMSKEQLRTERFARFFYQAGIRGLDASAFADSYLAALAGAGQLLEGVEKLLTALQLEYNIGLITNGLKEVQRPRLQASGLASFFSVVVVSDEIGPAKPQAAFFEYTFAEMGGPPPERVLVIGDNLHADVKGGHDFGTHTCWYNPQATPPWLEVQPTWEIRQLDELRGILL
jgi:2-haloacid dehalogenase